MSDRRGEHYDESGLIKADWLARHTPLEQATYFLCGPKPFLRARVTGLMAKDRDERFESSAALLERLHGLAA